MEQIANRALRSFLVTGATDGIGLLTARLLARTAPAVTEAGQKRVIAIHGRNPERIETALSQIRSEGEGNFVLKSFCYDLSDMEQVRNFADDILQTFPGGEAGVGDTSFGQLDCLVNNAAIFDDKGP